MSGGGSATGYIIGRRRGKGAWMVRVTETNHPQYGKRFKVCGQQYFELKERLAVSFVLISDEVLPSSKPPFGLIAVSLRVCEQEPIRKDVSPNEVWEVGPINTITVRFPNGEERCYFTTEPTFEDAHQLFEEESDNGEEQVVKFESFTSAEARQVAGDDGFSLFVALDALLGVDSVCDVLAALLTKHSRAPYRTKPKGKGNTK